MRVVVVSDHASINGGAAKVSLSTALALAKRGIETHLFAGMGPVDPVLQGVPNLQVTCLQATAYLHDSNPIRGASHGLWDRGAARAFDTVLASYDPADTVVHAHTFRDSLSSSVLSRASKRGFATIYTAHDYTLGCPYKGFFNFRENHICELRGLSMGCLKCHCNTSAYVKKLYYYTQQYAFVNLARIPRRLSHVIFLSELSRNVLLSYLPESARTSLVSNPFDFAGGEPATIDDASPFLFVGSLEKHKDPVTAALAAKAVGAPITFVGKGVLEEEIQRANPQAAIKGWLGRDEVAQEMRRSRALVFPSIWYECQPLTTMEAAACGLAIIASDKSAAVEQIRNLGVGDVYPGGEVDELASIMRRYMDSDFARSQGRASYEAFKRVDLSEERYFHAITEVYQQELDRRSSS